MTLDRNERFETGEKFLQLLWSRADKRLNKSMSEYQITTNGKEPD